MQNSGRRDVAEGVESANSRNEASQHQQIQKLMRLTGSIFEQRGYAGIVEVSWVFGMYQAASKSLYCSRLNPNNCLLLHRYQEKASLIFDRCDSAVAPWASQSGDEQPNCAVDLLDNEDSRSAGLLKQLLRRLETRARKWGQEDVPDDLSTIINCRDPLLGAVGSIGFSFFGVLGWSVSVSISIYASRLNRWRKRIERSWPLAQEAPRWRAVFNAISSPDGHVAGNDLRAAMTARSEIRDAADGVHRSSLRAAWHLADITRDGRLNFEEFVLFIHLVSRARAANKNVATLGTSADDAGVKAIPLYLPKKLVPPSRRKQVSCGSDATPIPSAERHSGRVDRGHARDSRNTLMCTSDIPGRTAPDSALFEPVDVSIAGPDDCKVRSDDDGCFDRSINRGDGYLNALENLDDGHSKLNEENSFEV